MTLGVQVRYEQKMIFNYCLFSRWSLPQLSVLAEAVFLFYQWWRNRRYGIRKVLNMGCAPAAYTSYMHGAVPRAYMCVYILRSHPPTLVRVHMHDTAHVLTRLLIEIDPWSKTKRAGS
jgi:hypothetical protein